MLEEKRCSMVSRKLGFECYSSSGAGWRTTRETPPEVLAGVVSVGLDDAVEE